MTRDCFGGILGGAGGGLDDVSVFFEGIEDVGEDENAERQQEGVGPDGYGEQGGDDDAAQAEENDEMTGE